ncbi:MAG: PAS domain S-box protein [Ignavibacteriales bacterium]|nr:PAS domain S-box protein [Ignavibacteriales bacterium]
MDQDKIKVLLIEDSLGDIRIISDMIRFSGEERFELNHNIQLNSALERIKNNSYDVILLDLNLPDSKGIETLEKLLTNVTDIPIVILGEVKDGNFELSAIQLGAQDYLIKGYFDDNLLIRSLLYAIERKKVKRKIEETTQLLEAIFDNTNMLLVYLDTNFNFVNVNRGFAEVNGKEKSFFIGKNYFDLIKTDGLAEIFKGVLTSGNSYSASSKQFIGDHLTERGITYWDWSLIPLRSPDGKIYGLVLSISDVTENVLAQKKFQEEHDRSQMYLDVAGVIILVVDPTQNVSMINKKGCDILGYKESEIVGKNWFDNFLPPVIKSEVKLVFDKVIKGELGIQEYYENPILIKSGKTRIIEWQNSYIKNEEGKIIATLSSGIDITDRKDIETQLKETNTRLDAIVSTAMDAIISIDSRQRIILFNNSAEKMFKYPVSEVLGNKLEMLLPEDYRKGHTKHIMNFSKTNVTSRQMGSLGTIVGLRANGEVFPIEASISQAEIGKEKIFTIILRDISARFKV